MANTWSEEFSRAVNTLHNLESTWSQAKLEGTNTASIERTIQELFSRMTDEELDAYGEYDKERLGQERDRIERFSQSIAEMKAELERRKTK
jgi:hypothetical protein